MELIIQFIKLVVRILFSTSAPAPTKAIGSSDKRQPMGDTLGTGVVIPPSTVPILNTPPAPPKPRWLKLVKKWEGCKLSPYLDTGGVPTIGYGTTYYEDGTKVTMNDTPLTQERADSLLITHGRKFEDGVRKLTVGAGLVDYQIAALTCLSYNIGLAALERSSLLRKIRANPSDQTIAAEFARWNRDNGMEVLGLTRRRKDEGDLYFGRFISELCD